MENKVRFEKWLRQHFPEGFRNRNLVELTGRRVSQTLTGERIEELCEFSTVKAFRLLDELVEDGVIRRDSSGRCSWRPLQQNLNLPSTPAEHWLWEKTDGKAFLLREVLTEENMNTPSCPYSNLASARTGIASFSRGPAPSLYRIGRGAYDWWANKKS